MSGRNTASGCFLFLLACGSTQPSTTDVGIEQGAADASTLVDVANFDALDRQDSSTQIDAGTLCSTGDALCDGQCVRLASNASHCGSCNAACATAQLCLSGSCVESCPTSAVACDGHCVNAQTDAQNCGGCGIACPGTQVCNAGACGCASGTQCQSACVNIENDPANCGACGHACVASEVCAQGSCQTSCATDRTGCQRSCVDLSNDRQNCGACATMCAGGASCQAGICLCDGTSVLCGDACVDTARDPQHCGACGMACSPGQACVASRCVSGCPTGQVACGGTCVDPNRDRNNCGGCGIACGAACNRGACVEPVATVGVYALHARMSDGSVYTWPADGSAEPSPVQGLSDVALLRGESGAQCALTTNHQILCWGHNEWGQLGIGNRVPIVATPTLVTALPPNFVPVDVERGRAFTCALSTTGLVRCWGTSYSRAVGIDSLAPQLDSVAIALPSPAIDIAVTGHRHWRRI